MARTGKIETPLESAPSHYPETTPPVYPSSDYSFTLQAIMEMQKTLGQLTQAVTTLTEESKKRGEVLDRISHKVYAAEVVIIVIGGILALITGEAFWLLHKIWDAIYPIIQLKPHP